MAMNKRSRYLLISLAGLVLAIGLSLSGTAQERLFPTSSLTPDQTEILWDTDGVPHITASTDRNLFYGFGWAQAKSHGNLLLRLYGRARGRAAEYWGESELDSDRWVQTMNVPDRAQRWYDAQSSTFRAYLDAFAEGINTYAQQHADQLDATVKVVLPVTGVDVLAHVQRVLHFTLLANPLEVLQLQPSTPTRGNVTRPMVDLHTWATLLQQSHRGITTADSTEQWHSARPSLGSNAWAIAPSRSASGNAMLLANPHLPWSDEFLWYEAHLLSQDINASGAALVGIPVLAIAFNDVLGWTHTINTHDGWDAYQLTLLGDGYQFDGKPRSFTVAERWLKVKQPDGTLREEPLTIRHAIQGPIVAEAEGTALALRVVGLEQPGLLEQWWDMARATNFAQFERILTRLQIPTFTILYADREGHIFHLFNGQVPIRNGVLEDWSGIVPGDTSETLWSAIHPYADLPKVLNPNSGWLQNANEPPWTTTFPIALDPSQYSPDIAPPPRMGLRAQRSAQMLAEDAQMTFEELITNKHSTHMALTDRVLDELIGAAKPSDVPIVRQAAMVLEQWDRQANAESQGAVLFMAWAEAMNPSTLFATPWQDQAPLTTPTGLANSQVALLTLEQAATQVQTTYGSLNVPWGEVFHLVGDAAQFPANGGPDYLGIFRHLWFAPQEDGTFTAIGGDSYVAAIEFSTPVRAMALLSYGNATQSAQRTTDQLEQFSQKVLRPVWRSREEIEAHLAEFDRL